MDSRRYLPSTQFALLIFSLFASVGLVYAAQVVTRPPSTAAVSSSDQAAAAAQADWQHTLNTIQAQSGVSLPQPPDPNTVNGMLQAAQSSNVTTSVARTLLVNLTNAKAQGLGDDAPTQNQLISQAVSQVQQRQQITSYTRNDLIVVDTSKAAEHAYGNALAEVLAKDPGTEYANTLIAIDNATSRNDATELQKLPAIAAKYTALTKQFLAVPVPQTLVPFHLQLVNNFKNIAGSYSGMTAMLTDPLQGLAGLQTYQSTTQETLHVFINIAQAFNKDGILFTSGEPGASWAALLSESQQ